MYSNFLHEDKGAMLQAFDSGGTVLWSQAFDWPRDLTRVEALANGALNLYCETGDILRVRPFDGRSESDRRDSVARDLGRRAVEREQNAPTVIADPGGVFVNVGGVKVPVRRSFEWKDERQ